MSGAFMWQLQYHFCFTISWSQFKTARHLTHEIALLYVMGTGIWQEHFLICSLLFSVSTQCRVTSVLKSVRLIWRSDSSRASRVASSCLLWNVKEWRRRKITNSWWGRPQTFQIKPVIFTGSPESSKLSAQQAIPLSPHFSWCLPFSLVAASSRATCKAGLRKFKEEPAGCMWVLRSVDPTDVIKSTMSSSFFFLYISRIAISQVQVQMLQCSEWFWLSLTIAFPRHLLDLGK